MTVPRRILAGVVVFAAALVGLPTASAAQVTQQPCAVGTPLAAVVYQLLNVQDFGLTGHVWALDNGFEQFVLYQTGPNTFCSIHSLGGTFSTFAGPSPAGTGQVPAGLTGQISARAIRRWTGTFAPTLPTRGFVGTFDAQCDQVTCQNPIRFGRRYLSVTPPIVTEWFVFVAQSRCGTWIQSTSGSQGDIACPGT